MCDDLFYYEAAGYFKSHSGRYLFLIQTVADGECVLFKDLHEMININVCFN